MKSEQDRIENCIRILNDGGLISLPTETVYGLGADALNPDAVLRIFAAKQRPSFNPIICHLADAETVFQYGRGNETAKRLARFWPGPLTVLLPHDGRIPTVVTAGSPLCAFRVPRHDLALQLLRRFKRPIAAPSANRSGKRSPTTAAMVRAQLGNFLPDQALLDGGPCEVGLESTVVSVMDREVHVLRHGGVSVEQLRESDFTVVDRAAQVDESAAPHAGSAGLQSPGSLLAHYAPEGELWLMEAETSGIPTPAELGASAGRVTYLAFGDFSPPVDTHVLNLSPSGDVHEAARNLFAYFDRMQARDLVIAMRLPDRGLGRAVNDRLFRAAARIITHQGGRWSPIEKK